MKLIGNFPFIEQKNDDKRRELSLMEITDCNHLTFHPLHLKLKHKWNSTAAAAAQLIALFLF